MKPIVITDARGRERKLLGLDYETYYSPQYTLKKLTTTAYVRDSRFRAHGVAVCDGERAYWVTHKDIPDFMRSINWEETALLAHNTAFDGFITTQIYKSVPAYYVDTMSMSAGEFGCNAGHSLDALAKRLDHGAKLQGALKHVKGVQVLSDEDEALISEYAINDIQLTWDCFADLYFARGYPTDEMHIIDLTIRCFCEPKLEVDAALCDEEIAEEYAVKSALVQKCGVAADVLMSNQQLAAHLQQLGIDPPTKISERTGKETWAMSKADEAFLALESHPVAGPIIQARRAVKSTISETRAFRLKQHGEGGLPIMLNYARAITHRWSGGDSMNPQNLPAGRKGQSNRLRRAIRAPKGYRFLKVDSSQAECRVSAGVSNEQELLGIFQANGDPYVGLASKVFNRPITKQDPEERAVGKAGELSLQFGVGAEKFTHSLRVGAGGTAIPDFPLELGQRTVEIYRSTRLAVIQAWREVGECLAAMPVMKDYDHMRWGPDKLYHFENDRILMPNGLYIHYPALYASDTGRGIEYYFQDGRDKDYLYPAKVYQHLIQSTARSIVAWQLLQLTKEVGDLVMLVHDEGDFVVREEEADAVCQFAEEVFSWNPPWFPYVRLAGEAKHGESYALD